MTKPRDLLPDGGRAASVARALIKMCCRIKVLLLRTQSSGTNVPAAPVKGGGVEQHFFLAPTKFSSCFRN